MHLLGWLLLLLLPRHGLVAQHGLVGVPPLVFLARHLPPPHLPQLSAAGHRAVPCLALLGVQLQQAPHAPAQHSADHVMAG